MNRESTSEIKYMGAFLVIAVGLIVITILALKIPTAPDAWKPSDITTLIGSLTTFLGSVVGAFLGVQVGAAGKSKLEADRAQAEAGRDKAETLARKALAALSPEDAKNLLQ